MNSLSSNQIQENHEDLLLVLQGLRKAIASKKPGEISVKVPPAAQPLVQVAAPEVRVEPQITVETPPQTLPEIILQVPPNEVKEPTSYEVEVTERRNGFIHKLTITPNQLDG
tara:strand:- start:1273 stop:1608 length:336 start_codon:yes stop_codon:yes gene_type:complete